MMVVSKGSKPVSVYFFVGSSWGEAPKSWKINKRAVLGMANSEKGGCLTCLYSAHIYKTPYYIIYNLYIHSSITSSHFNLLVGILTSTDLR